MQRLPVGLAFAVGLSVAADEKASKPAPAPVRLAFPPVTGKPVKLLASLGKMPGSNIRLARPFGAAVDEADRVYVADPSQRRVVVYDRKADSVTAWTGNQQFPLAGPTAVAVDRSGRLFAADGFSAQVVVFDRSGTPVAAFGKGLLKRPGGIAVDSRGGRVWVGDLRDNRVISFDLKTFAPGTSIGEPSGKGPGPGFSSPSGLAVNSQGWLYVADMWNCRVQIFSPDGALLRRFPTQCSREGEHGRANLIAIDADDRVYVAGPESGSLQIFTAEGKPAQCLGSLGPPAAAGTLRTGLAVDSQGRILVVEHAGGEGRVRIFSPAREVKGEAMRTSRLSPGPRP